MIAIAAIPVISIPAAPSQTSEWCAATITGVPAIRSATRSNVIWNELPPRMSPTASCMSPSRTAAMPLEISGKAVANASTVAPKTAPVMWARAARRLPESCSSTPATSVTAAAARKTARTTSVDARAYGCSSPWRR